MQTKEYKTIDRIAEKWPSGPWDNEQADKLQWQDSATGLPCLAVRNWSGAWCGYVGVNESHPLHGKDYHDVDVIEVHGGLTFANSCRPHADESKGVCHVPEQGEPDHVWWFGFDCAHAWDYSPRDKVLEAEKGYPYTIGYDRHYRTLDYVKSQCSALAGQLITF